LVTRSRKFKLSEFIQKVDVPGKAICTLCDSFISYGGRGVALIIEHCKGKKHVEKVKAKATNYSLDYLLTNGQAKSSAPSTSSSSVSQNIPTDTGFKPMINMMDRVSNSEVRLNLFQTIIMKKNLVIGIGSVFN